LIALAATADHRPSNLALALARHRAALTATGLLIVLVIAVTAVTPGPPSYFELAFTSSGGATIALTAIGQTLVVLSGGFDLSCGMTVSLVNVVLATYMQESLGSEITFGVTALAIGAAVGVFNGFFVAFFRLQPIVVTLASMFLIHGITLMVASEAGGAIPTPFIKFLTGDLIPGAIPSALVVVAIAIAIWLFIKRTRFGTAIYAVGSDALSAQAAGIPVKWTRFFTYVVAGTFYGAAGAFISAQAGAGDPLVGTPLLLESFTAVVLGGTVLGGGRGGCVGTVVGAYVLLLLVNVLIVLQVSSFYSSLVEGVVLLVAVLAYSLNRRSELYVSLSKLAMRFNAWRAGTLVSQRAMVDKALRSVSFAPPVLIGARRRGSWLQRNGEVLRFVLPAWVCFVLVVIATGIVYGPRMVATVHYFDTVIEIAALLSILALGQGTVIMAGGFDLSIPWALTLCGIVASELISGSDLRMLWAIPIVLGIGALIGLANGFGVVFLGMPPIVITLATNGILQGVSLVHTEGHTKGYASTSLHWLMTGKVWGVTPVVAFVACFAAFSVILLGRTGFGRRVLAVGNSARVAELSGIGVGGTIVATYVLCGMCSALVGIMSVGLIGRASLDMGQDFLLPSIAVVVVGGTLITGGRGHYLGMLGGVLLLTALQIIFSGTSLPPSTRDVIFGLVMLASVLALPDR
jgi:ribose transport system permease protein